MASDILGGATRAADAAVWSRADLDPTNRGVARVPPVLAIVLAIDVAGRDDNRRHLDDKARWYLDVGVALVWLVYPESREVAVVTAAGTTYFRPGDTLPPHPAIPDLTPAVHDFFVLIEAAGSPG